MKIRFYIDPETDQPHIYEHGALAFNLCSRGDLSTSLAARLAGLSYEEFLQAAAQRHVELFPVDLDELKEELARPLPDDVNLEKIKEDLARAQARRS